MKKKKKKIEQWEKDWDKTFKSLLSKEIAVKGCGVSMNMNDYAKQFISGLIYKKTKDLFDRHNLLALSFDKIQRLNDNKSKIRLIILGNIKEAEKIEKELKKLLKNN